MCFYEQYEFICRDFRWGNCKEQCNKEYRMGETCGMKLVHSVVQIGDSCNICKDIEKKCRRLDKEQARIKTWEMENRMHELPATVEKTQKSMKTLTEQILALESERVERNRAIGRSSRGSNQAYQNPAPAYNVAYPSSNGYGQTYAAYGYDHGYATGQSSSYSHYGRGY